MATIHAVLRGNGAQRAVVRGFLLRHGWIDGNPPSTPAERASSLDFSGGGDGEFSIELAAAADPTGPVTAYALRGWTIDTSGTTRRDLLEAASSANGVQIARLGSEKNPTKIVWWEEGDATFEAGIAQLGYAVRQVPVI